MQTHTKQCLNIIFYVYLHQSFQVTLPTKRQTAPTVHLRLAPVGKISIPEMSEKQLAISPRLYLGKGYGLPSSLRGLQSSLLDTKKTTEAHGALLMTLWSCRGGRSGVLRLQLRPETEYSLRLHAL